MMMQFFIFCLKPLQATPQGQMRIHTLYSPTVKELRK